MKKNKVLILIPARYESSRFVGKPLALIKGKPMIQWVYENCVAADDELSKIYDIQAFVVTDDERIQSVVNDFSGKCLLVKDDVVSGTQRIHLALTRFFTEEFDLVINVQGDEPLIDSHILKNLCDFHLGSNFDIATVVSRKTSENREDFLGPNCVKVIFEKQSGSCQYFSRAPIPYFRDQENGEIPKYWYHHIGIYSYRVKSLNELCSSPITYYEDTEKLEQLRAYSLGHSIGAVETDKELIGVDVKEDIEKLEEVLSETKSTK